VEDEAPDRYTPHCDGDCTGLPHKYGTRMATVVMYCTVADRGGHTNFRNAGVHVKPRRGDAIFFSYIDPESKLMDSGFTEHSGCPVFEGTKKIVTQWVRYGVDSDRPWNSFNTLGIHQSELEGLEVDDGEAKTADLPEEVRPPDYDPEDESDDFDDDQFDMESDDDQISDDELTDDDIDPSKLPSCWNLACHLVVSVLSCPNHHL